MRPGAAIVDVQTGEQWESSSGPTTYEHIMRDGPFAREHPADVVERAIAWWHGYLDEIDNEAGR